jgi:hypothetical protein
MLGRWVMTPTAENQDWFLQDLDAHKALDLLSRLYRAVEAEGRVRFLRDGFNQEWVVYRLGEQIGRTFAWTHGKEEDALARCLRAACAVEVV